MPDRGCPSGSAIAYVLNRLPGGISRIAAKERERHSQGELSRLGREIGEAMRKPANHDEPASDNSQRKES